MRAAAGEVVFAVRDTGAGIASDDLPHLFERFWQASAGRRRGAGPSVAIVKGLVEARRGRVWVESLVDVGTTVSFAVPTAQRAHDEPWGGEAQRG